MKSSRSRGTNPRARGTNPRAVDSLRLEPWQPGSYGPHDWRGFADRTLGDPGVPFPSPPLVAPENRYVRSKGRPQPK